jgi:hypothetical protein
MKKRGRPKASAGTAKEVHISTRFTAELKARLERSAADNGISLSEDIARRLDRSFEEEGRKIKEFGGYVNYAFCRLIAYAFEGVKYQTGHPWSKSPFAYRHAKTAAEFIMEAFRPRGSGKVPSDHPYLQSLRERGASAELIKSVAADLKITDDGKMIAISAVFALEAAIDGAISPGHQELKALVHDLGPKLIAAGRLPKIRSDIQALVSNRNHSPKGQPNEQT